MNQRKHPTRNGAAFLIMVVALLVVILAASNAMLRGEVASQRNQRKRMQTDTLLRSIAATESMHHDWQTDLVLPIDQDQSIHITANDDKTQLTAKWLRGTKTQNSITRQIKPHDDDSNPESKDET